MGLYKNETLRPLCLLILPGIPEEESVLGIQKREKDNHSMQTNEAKARYAQYLTTDYWKAVEREVKSRAGFRCQVCNSQHDLQAHHRTYEHRGKELEHLADLTCLCRRCHAVFHGQLVTQEKQAEPKPSAGTKRQKGQGMTNVKAHTPEEVEAMMPPGVMPVTLTQELIARCRTNLGAFTTATILALDPADNVVGWPARLIGKTISRDQYRAAIEG